MSRGTSRERRRATIFALALLAPTGIGLLIFTVLPIIASVGLSVFRWDLITPPQFVGLDNYTAIVTDDTFLASWVNTIGFVVIAVLLQMGLGLLSAMLLLRLAGGWLQTVFRSAFFLPLILSAASISIVMRYLFNENFGVVNYLLGTIGIPRVPWLTDELWARVALILVYVWQQYGFSFLLFVGGLNNIPREMYEAASVDGAHGWSRFRGITLPLLSPTILVASVVGVINALQVFDQPYVLTQGGPGDSTRTVVMVIYQTAFQSLNFGGASAMAVVLLAVILAVTGLQFRLSRRFVFYQ
jgi:multiple sugar transport system permease protein